jgi:hypothetical protein
MNQTKSWLLASVAIVAALPAYASSTGVPVLEAVGPLCTKFFVGGHEWAFNTNTNFNQAQRIQAIYAAMVGGFAVQVSTASEVGTPPVALMDEQVTCSGGASIDTPAQILQLKVVPVR